MWYFYFFILESCYLIIKEEIKASFYCNKCNKKFCTDCKDFHISKVKHEQNIKKIEEILNIDENKCKEHKENELEFFCVDCENIICKICCVSTHNTHIKMEIKESKDKIKEINENKMKNYEKIIKENLLNIEKNEKEYEKNIKNFEEELLNLEKEINNKILNEKENIKNNKIKKNDVLIQYQRFLNIKNILIEKPIQFLINFNIYFNKIDRYYKNIYGFGYFIQSNEEFSDILVPTKFYFNSFEIKNISCSSYATFIITSINLLKFR
jgi:hypothetical protein